MKRVISQGQWSARGTFENLMALLRACAPSCCYSAFCTLLEMVLLWCISHAKYILKISHHFFSLSHFLNINRIQSFFLLINNSIRAWGLTLLVHHWATNQLVHDSRGRARVIFLRGPRGGGRVGDAKFFLGCQKKFYGKKLPNKFVWWKKKLGGPRPPPLSCSSSHAWFDSRRKRDCWKTGEKRGCVPQASKPPPGGLVCSLNLSCDHVTGSFQTKKIKIKK